MKPAAEPVKKLNLGISGALRTAKQFANDENIHAVVSPQSGPAISSTPEPQPLQPPQPPTNVHTLPPKSEPQAPASAPRKGRGPQPSPTRRFSVDLPLYVLDQLHDKVHDTRMDKKEIILEALREGGFKIKDIDIYKKGKPRV